MDQWQEALAVYEDMVAREADLEDQLARVRRVKALAVAALHSTGATQDQVAEAIGVSRPRVGQMAARGHATALAQPTESPAEPSGQPA